MPEMYLSDNMEINIIYGEGDARVGLGQIQSFISDTVEYFDNCPLLMLLTANDDKDRFCEFKFRDNILCEARIIDVENFFKLLNKFPKEIRKRIVDKEMEDVILKQVSTNLEDYSLEENDASKNNCIVM